MKMKVSVYGSYFYEFLNSPQAEKRISGVNSLFITHIRGISYLIKKKNCPRTVNIVNNYPQSSKSSTNNWLLSKCVKYLLRIK